MSIQTGMKHIFAHRGASALAPENTLPAFELALESGVDGVELDVILSKDKQLIVVHDFYLDRTSTVKGEVQDLTLDEIKKADAGSWFGEEFKGTTIPTLQEVFDLIGGKMLINIELKMKTFDRSQTLSQEVYKLVQKYGIQDTIIYSSFNPYALLYLKLMDKKTHIGLLSLGNRLGKVINFIYGNLLLRPNAYHLNTKHVTKEKIARLHKKGVLIRSYTVNDQEEMKRFFDWEIDGIFTDDPFLGLSVRNGEE